MPLDGLNFGYTDQRYVNVSGDTMTGDLTISGANYLYMGTEESAGMQFNAHFYVFSDHVDVDTIVQSGRNILLQATGDTIIEGPLIINPADGTADPLAQILTTGTNQYGWDVGTFDLTGIGFGKYPSLISRSNGVLGDGLGVIEGGLVIGNDVTGAFGQGLVLLDNATLTSMTILADWDWDGGGNNRMVFNDDVLFQQNMEVTGTLSAGTLQLDTLTIGDNTTYGRQKMFTFDLVNYNGELYFDDSATANPVGYYFGDCGISNAVLVAPGYSIYFGGTAGNQYIENNSDNGDHGVVISGSHGTWNAGATFCEIQYGGTNLPADGYFMKWTGMANEGTILKMSLYGDLEFGQTVADHDVLFSIMGKTNTFVSYWMEDEDYWKIQDDILINSTEKLYFNDTSSYIYDDGSNLIFTTDGNWVFNNGSERFAVGADGQVYAKNHINIVDAGNIILDTTTGTKIGTATTQKLGFYNATPIVQPTALTTQLTTLTYTEPSTPDYAIQDLTNSSPYGFVTQDEGNSVLKVIANLQTRISELETRIQALGLIA